MKRAALYARVSGDDRGKEGRNLAGQLEMGREYAQKHGYTIIDELAEDDRGASGAEIDLPQLNRVRDMARAGEVDVLVVRELDRLSRNLAKQLIVEQELAKDGVKVEYVLYDFPDTPEGRLNKNIRAMLAEYEREKTTERTTRARRRKVREGHVITRSRPPFGYRSTEAGGKVTLKAYEPESQTVRLIFGWYTVGDGENGPLSTRAIAKRLTGMSVPTWNDIHKKAGKKRGNGEWAPSTIAYVLKNETYIGVWRYSGIPVDVPAIVDCETFEAARKRRAHNLAIAKRNRKYDYLLAGHIRCKSCGMSVCGTSKKTPKRLYLYYRCSTATDHIASTKVCDIPSFRADQVDAAVWGWVKSFLTDPVALAEGLRAEQAEREEANEPLRDRVAVVDDLLADNRRQLERALDLYLSGDFPKEILTERKARLEQTVSALERERVGLAAQLDAQTFTDEQVQTITEFAQQVARGLETADQDFEARRRVVDMLDVRATLAVEDGEKVVYAWCMVGEGALSVASTSSERTAQRS